MKENDYGMCVAFYRKKAGLSQEELAQKSNLSQAIIAKIETGKRKLTIDSALALALSLEISVDVLLDTCSVEKSMNNPDKFNAIGMGKRLRHLRNNLNMTQAMVAEILGCKIETYNTIECGKRRLRDEEIVNLAVLLKTSTDYILRGIKEETTNDP